MTFDEIKKQRQKWLTWKNIAPLRAKLEALPKIDCDISLNDCIKITSTSITKEEKEQVLELALELKPWRKGPFDIFDIFIDSEWKSFQKYKLLKKYFDLKDKVVVDIGCNNGYYMFKMQEDKPKSLVGFDPSPHYKSQFDFINHFVKSDIDFELLGVEHLSLYPKKFDTIFCLGVLYHRSDPVSCLKSLQKALNKNGEIFLDTFMIDGEEEYALIPKEKYSKIPNVYFIPTIKALSNFCYKAGLKSFEVLEIVKTLPKEQRRTQWIDGESLNNFLDPKNNDLTIEGYPAPKRVYVKLGR